LTGNGDSMKGSYAGPDGNGGSVTVTRTGGPAPAPAATAASGIAGKWKASARSSDGREYKLELAISAQNGDVSGTLTTDEGTTAMLDPQLKGSTLTFQLSARGATYDVKLNLAGDSLNGTYSAQSGDKGTVTAQR
jgi:hypothetical protein